MTAPKTTPSTRRLSEVARHVVIPSGIVTTGWPAVEKQCKEFGDTFDTWQQGAGRVILGKRSNGMYAATIGGVTLSIPRQVAKTFLIGRIVVALCVLFPGTKVLWTAHRTRTASNTFKGLQGYTKRKMVAPHIAAIRVANGEQEIAFVNGSVIMFGAREAGFGRGFDEVDIEVFDEAQILTEKALDDMVAATNQSRHPHGALLFFMGTPPRPTDPGEAFTIRRDEALAHKEGRADFAEPTIGDDAVLIECSADQDADPDDQAQWAKANPSFPHRTPLTSLLRLRKNLPSVDSWRREALGIWDTTAGVTTLIDMDLWLLPASNGGLLDPASKEESHLRLALDVSPDRKWASFGAAGRRGDARLHVEIVDRRPGTAWVLARAAELEAKYGALYVQSRSPAEALVAPLIEAGRKVEVVDLTDHAKALGQFIDATANDGIRHIGQPWLESALRAAKLRHSGDVELLGRRSSRADICGLVAVVLASGQVPEPVHAPPPLARVISY